MAEHDACDLQEQPASEDPQEETEETAVQQAEDEQDDDPAITQGQVGKLLFLCLLVAVGGTAAGLLYFYFMGYFAG